MARRDLHTEWLSLLEISGPFLNAGVLGDVFPQGLDEHIPELSARVRLAYGEWADDQLGLSPDPRLHRQWLEFVLAEVLEFEDETLDRSASERYGLELPEHHVTLQPDVAVVDPDDRSARMLVALWPAGQTLDEPPADDAYTASPLERMVQLCRAHDVFGLVTNGRQWTFVHAAIGEAPGFASWYAHLWVDEPLTLRSFRTLLGVRRFFAAAEDATLDRMLDASALSQEEITTQLGTQVRHAVEVLVQALDRADVDSGRELLGNVADDRIYEASVTVMMRLVFLFSAEERGLLLLDDPSYEQYYAVSPLGAQLRADADRIGVQVLERRFDAWSRLCATFRAVYGGVEHDRLRLIAYGGSLFDPDRFAFLEGRLDGTSWLTEDGHPLAIDNRTVLHLLEALQILQERGREPRRISFRALDVEQIGHIYEGLLDHRAVRVDEPFLGLGGAASREPEVVLSGLTSLVDDQEALVARLRSETGRSESALMRGLGQEIDARQRERLLVACGNDSELFEGVIPFAGLLREDVWGYPQVYPRDTLLVTSGFERRSTQTFYTPRALAEEVVQYALEPLAYRGPSEGLPRDKWRLRSVQELLDLKICDPTMGSGAFLVAACRWLAERLVEAWAAASTRDGPVTIGGQQSVGLPDERLVPSDSTEQIALARLLVAEGCLYGVDVNPFAVEMAKLSVWLVTLAHDRPFGFLDHALKCGDSLLGVTRIEQVRYMHLDPGRGKVENKTLWFDFERDVAPVVDHAAAIRAELESFPVIEVADAVRKAALHEEAEEDLVRVQELADATVASAIGELAGRGTYEQLLRRVRSESERSGDTNLKSEIVELLNAELPAGRPVRRPFHWPIEFPEVFARALPGFDAIVANPPFLGGQRITGTLGTDYREYLVTWLAGGNRGSADLSAYFVTRFAELARPGGTVGSLATNSIGQGITREVGLSHLLEGDHALYRAVTSRPWPGSANLEIAELWLKRGSWAGECNLNRRRVPEIDSSLISKGRVAGEPKKLAANRQRSFQGSNTVGAGFILTEEEAMQLRDEDPRNRDVVLPFLIGRDISSRPDQGASRWAIYFADWPEDRARHYPSPFEIVEKRVKPERQHNARKAQREKWWRFHRPTVNLYEKIADMDRVLVKAAVSSTWAWVYVPNGQIFDHRLYVFAVDDWGDFGVLQSFVHREWMWRFSATLRTDDTYTPTKVFEPFPFPDEVLSIRGIAEEFHEYRAAVCLERDEGLTTLANRVDDPNEGAEDIVRMRTLQVALDEAVFAAYGWQELLVHHAFREIRGKLRYALDEPVAIEVVDRLLELNHQRHQLELSGDLPSTIERTPGSDLDGLPLFGSSSEVTG